MMEEIQKLGARDYSIKRITLDSYVIDTYVKSANEIYALTTESAYCIDSDGLIKWSKDLDEFGERQSILADDNNVYLGYSHGIVCLNKRGDKQWSWSIRDAKVSGEPETLTNIASDENHVYALTHAGTVHCLDKEGNYLWSYSAKTKGHAGSIFVDSKNLYIATSHHIYKIDKKSRKKSTFRSSPKRVTTPVFIKDDVYFCATKYLYGPHILRDSYVRSIKKTGRKRWKFIMRNYMPDINQIYANDDKVFLGTKNYSHVICLDNSTGKLLWEFTSPPPTSYRITSISAHEEVMCFSTWKNLYIFQDLDKKRAKYMKNKEEIYNLII
jgi:outer membrane protein assembly factor BamB